MILRSRISLKMRNLSDKFYEIMRANMVQPNRPQITIYRARALHAG
jgi:hypothetical protein